MAASVDRDDVIDRWAHGVRILEALVDRFPADPADAAGGQDRLLRPFKRQSMTPVMVGAVPFLLWF